MPVPPPVTTAIRFVKFSIGTGCQVRVTIMTMAVGAIVTFPLFPGSVATLSESGLILRMVMASLLAVVIGFGAEMQALRGLPPHIVSVLLAGNPAVAFAVGYVVLGQPVTGADVLGTLCVAAAGIAVTREASRVSPSAAPLD